MLSSKLTLRLVIPSKSLRKFNRITIWIKSRHRSFPGLIMRWLVKLNSFSF